MLSCGPDSVRQAADPEPETVPWDDVRLAVERGSSVELLDDELERVDGFEVRPESATQLAGWTPDGRSLLLARSQDSGVHWTLWRAADSQTLHELHMPTRRHGGIQKYAVSVAGGGILLDESISHPNGSIAGSRRLEWIDLATGEGRRFVYSSELERLQMTHSVVGHTVYVELCDVELGREPGLQRVDMLKLRLPEWSPAPAPVRRTATDGLPSPSPEGRRVAYAQVNEDMGQLVVASSEGQVLTRLASDADDRHPIWSPAADQIVFSRDGLDAMLWDLDEGSVRTLATLEHPFVVHWSPGGRHLALYEFLEPRKEYFAGCWPRGFYGGGALHLLADLGDRIELASGPVGSLAWSPGGDRLAWTDLGLHVRDVNSGEQRALDRVRTFAWRPLP